MSGNSEQMGSAEVAFAIEQATIALSDEASRRILDAVQIMRGEAVTVAPSASVSTHFVDAGTPPRSAKPMVLVSAAPKRIRLHLTAIGDQCIISTDPGGAGSTVLDKYICYRIDTTAPLWLVEGRCSVIEEFRA